MMQVAPILTKNQVALPKVHRSHGGNFGTGKATRQIVTSFPQKLYEIIGNPDTDHLIRWSEDGNSFSVLDPERFAHDILPYWFKHSNINSFVRQLNTYGFHKIPHPQQGALRTSSETQFWNFAHPIFQRGQPDLLCLITTARKRQAGQDDALQLQEKDTSRTSGLNNANPNTMIDANAVLNGIAAIKRHQITISTELNDLKAVTQHLWKEALVARERHRKHQDIIDTMIKFIRSIFGNVFSSPKEQQTGSSSQTVYPQSKRRRLMIEYGDLVSSPNAESLISRLEEINDTDEFDIPTVHSSGVGHGLDNGTPSPSLLFPTMTPLPILSSHSPATTFNNDPRQHKMLDPSLTSNTLSSSSLQYPTHANLNEQPFLNASTSAPEAANQVASSLQNNSENVLQSLLNNPTQLQRLLATFTEQQNVLSSGPSEPSSSTFDTYSSSAHPNQPFARPENAQVGPLLLSRTEDNSSTSPALMFQEKDGISSFAPLADSSSQLQAAHRDAKTINADVESLQASINDLLENLGLDPESVKELGESHYVDDPVPSSVMNGPSGAKPDTDQISISPSGI